MNYVESLDHQFALIARLLELGYILLNGDAEIHSAKNLNTRAEMYLKTLHDYYPQNTDDSEDAGCYS